MSGALPVQPDTEFIRDVLRQGGADFKKCMQCSTCTCTCELSTEAEGFPRRQVLEAQWGQKERLLADPAPWLCFYCGECSRICPRGANPGETMMALRRVLTAEYDWTGLARRMYRSAAWEIGVLALVAAIVVLLFTLPAGFGFGLLAQFEPNAIVHVDLDKFAPVHVVHRADTMMAMGLGLLLLINAARMFRFLTRGAAIPARCYLGELRELVLQGVFQQRWRECKEPDSQRNWLRHLALVSGYVTIFSLVVIFLPWFQRQDSAWHWTSIPGYYSTAILLGTTGWILLDRLGRRTEMHRFSHLSDWLFPILLFLTAATGILVHIVRLMDLAMATYILYMVHLAIAVPMLVVEVPFGKWSHLLYRPLAIYVAAVKRRAMES
jgi:hypothetical protein